MSHPAVKNAVVALLNGVDPMAYLTADPTTEIVLREVVAQADKLDAKRRETEIKAIGIAVGNALKKVFK